jgi:hypothetical protein
VTQPTAYARTPQPDDFGGRGVLLGWPDFVLWLRGKKTGHDIDGERVKLPPPWKPGQHWALIGKTREGKTNFAGAVLRETRKFVLALDPKGEDETLTALGWTRVTGVPPRKKFPKEVQQALDEGKPVRLIIGLDSRTAEDDAANKRLMADTIEYSRQARGWTVYVDEHQIATDPRMFNLGPQVARASVSAARGKTSVVTTMQYLSWSEKAPIRQASLISFWRSRSRDLMRKLAEETGRDWQELAAIADELPRYHVATLSDDLRSPVVVTKPPKIG